jgi:tRNA (guanosine-2'-O-)-methyltransferase
MVEDLDFSRSRIAWGEKIQVGELSVTPEQIVALLGPSLTSERIARLNEVVARRSLHMVTVLENIYDRGNASAVMRSAEAFGFLRLWMVDRPGARFRAANRVSKGTEKWLDVHMASTPEDCARNLRQNGYQLWATDLDTSHSIDTLDWSKPIAVVLGNEKDGVSSEMKSLCDGTFRIPMQGFAQSFNISVAGALIYYHAHLEARKLGAKALLGETERQSLLANYYLRCFDNPEGLLRNLI